MKRLVTVSPALFSVVASAADKPVTLDCLAP